MRAVRHFHLRPAHHHIRSIVERTGVKIDVEDDGLLHVSEMANYRVANVRDELKEGEQVKARRRRGVCREQSRVW